MTALWTGCEIAEATGGKLTQDFEVSGLSIDSRTIVPGDLFIALTDQRDGHEFVVQPSYDAAIEDYIRPLFQQHYTMSFENYPVELERIEHPHLRECSANGGA